MCEIVTCNIRLVITFYNRIKSGKTTVGILLKMSLLALLLGRQKSLTIQNLLLNNIHESQLIHT